MLPALELDFRSTAPRWPALGLVLLIVGVLAAAYTVNEAWALHDQISLAQAKLEHLNRGAKPRPLPPLDTETLHTEVRAANEILQQLALPWNALFLDLETTGDKQIALLSIQPDAGKKLVRITGEAKNFDALLAYMTRLEQSKTLRQVYLSSHEVRMQDPDKPVRFALTAAWVVTP